MVKTTFWQKQTEPLFPNLEWDKPERRDQAGSICIVGGNLHALRAPSSAFEAIKQTGPSAVRIILPDKTKRLVDSLLPEALFLPSTTSGEFSREGELELFEQLAWADTLLLPGDTGRNSETTVLLAQALRAFNGLVVITRDSFDSLMTEAALLAGRPRTSMVVSFAQLQRMAKSIGSSVVPTFTMDLVKLVDFLHSFTTTQPISIITLHHGQLMVADNGSVSTTKLKTAEGEPQHWRIELAALISCYQTWYPNQPFEAISQAVYSFCRLDEQR